MSINIEAPIHYLTPTNESNEWSLSSGDARTAGTNLTLDPQALIDARPEYVVLAGWMHVFGDDFRSAPILTSPNPVWSSQSLALLESAVDADLSPRDERLSTEVLATVMLRIVNLSYVFQVPSLGNDATTFRSLTPNSN